MDSRKVAFDSFFSSARFKFLFSKISQNQSFPLLSMFIKSSNNIRDRDCE